MFHFAYNCKNYFPYFDKCFFLINKRKEQEDLIAIKWLSVREALIYASSLKIDLKKNISDGRIPIKRDKEDKGGFRIGFESAWEYDECPLAKGAGECMFFEAHKGKHIYCLAEKETVEEMHPNYPKMPSQDVIGAFKDFLQYFQQANKGKKKSLFE